MPKLLLALAIPGCSLESPFKPVGVSYCDHQERPLGYEETTELGFSARELVEAHSTRVFMLGVDRDNVNLPGEPNFGATSVNLVPIAWQPALWNEDAGQDSSCDQASWLRVPVMASVSSADGRLVAEGEMSLYGRVPNDPTAFEYQPNGEFPWDTSTALSLDLDPALADAAADAVGTWETVDSFGLWLTTGTTLAWSAVLTGSSPDAIGSSSLWAGELAQEP